MTSSPDSVVVTLGSVMEDSSGLDGYQGLILAGRKRCGLLARRVEGHAVRAVGQEVPLARPGARRHLIHQGGGTPNRPQHMQVEQIVGLVPHAQHDGGLAQAVAVVGDLVRAPVDDGADGQDRVAVRVAWRALGSARSRGALRSRRTGGADRAGSPRCALRPRSTGGSLDTGRSLRALAALRPLDGTQVEPGRARRVPDVRVVERLVRVALGLRLAGQRARVVDLALDGVPQAGRADRSFRPRWTDRPLNTLRSLRARDALGTDGSRRPSGTDRPLNTLRTLRTGGARGSGVPRETARSLRTDVALGTLRAGGPGGSLAARGSRRPLQVAPQRPRTRARLLVEVARERVEVPVPNNARGACRCAGALEPLLPRSALRARAAGSADRPLGSLRAIGASSAGGTLGTRGALRSLITLWPLRALLSQHLPGRGGRRGARRSGR